MVKDIAVTHVLPGGAGHDDFLAGQEFLAGQQAAPADDKRTLPMTYVSRCERNA